MPFRPVPEQLALLTRGVVDLHVREELEERLSRSRESGTPLRVKAGFDPTRPDLHLGHVVLMQKLRQFQELGHRVIFLVGDFTAMVGDPTGQNELRPRLTREEVREAAETYTKQAFLILDAKATELRYNSEWIDRLNSAELVELMAKTTVSRMLERKDFGERFASEKPIYQHEFLYPLLQGYDSVALKCDIELGGTDQLFNLLVGRDIMPKYGLRGQMVMTTPILEGIDAKMEGGKVVGKKMSKSADNYIGLLEEPLSMYRKVMQVDDKVIFRYFELLSSRSNAEIAALKSAADPLGAKRAFADEIIQRFHGGAAASRARADFDTAYLGDELPRDIPEHAVTTTLETLWLAKALSSIGFAKTTSEGKRLLKDGWVEVDRAHVTDENFQLEIGKRYLLKVGSKNRRFAYVTVTRA
jgi:tyrosyl-tRNA synthetase